MFKPIGSMAEHGDVYVCGVLMVRGDGGSQNISENEIVHHDVYPNPFRNNLWVADKNANLKLYDLKGRIVKSGIYNLSTDQVSAGMYLFQVASSKGASTHKVCKQ